MLGVKRNSEHVNVTEGKKSQQAFGKKKAESGWERQWLKKREREKRDKERGNKTWSWNKQIMSMTCAYKRDTEKRGPQGWKAPGKLPPGARKCRGYANTVPIPLGYGGSAGEVEGTEWAQALMMVWMHEARRDKIR